MRAAVLALVLMLLSGVALADSVSGVWRHSEKPAWISIEFADGTGKGVIVRHDENPAVEGQELFNRIVKSNSADNQWSAYMYVASERGFKPMTLELGSDDTLLVRDPEAGGEIVLRLFSDAIRFSSYSPGAH